MGNFLHFDLQVESGYKCPCKAQHLLFLYVKMHFAVGWLQNECQFKPFLIAYTV